MKKLLPTLLIATSLALCILAAFQWVQSAKQWERIDNQNVEIFNREKSLQSFTNQVGILSGQIGVMEGRIDVLNGTVNTNKQEIFQLSRELNKAQVRSTNLVQQLADYKNAFEVATNKLALAYESIKQQNDTIKEAIAHRDDFVAQLNESRNERNEIVRQYNELVEQVKKQQEEAASPPSNAKPAKPSS